MARILLFFMFAALTLLSCSSQKGSKSGATHANSGDIVAQTLEISLTVFDAAENVDTKLLIGIDGSITFREHGSITKKGSLTEAELQELVTVFSAEKFLTMSSGYLSTQVVKGPSYTIFYKDDTGHSLVNFYHDGAPRELLTILDAIQRIAIPHLK